MCFLQVLPRREAEEVGAPDVELGGILDEGPDVILRLAEVDLLEALLQSLDEPGQVDVTTALDEL